MQLRNHKYHSLYLTLAIILAFSSNSAISQESLSPRIANYNMDITLDVDTKMIQGKTQLTWTNPSENVVDHLLFHIYYNAFKNSNSTFMKERGVPSFLTQNIDEDCGWGWSKMDVITDEAGNNLTSGIHYIQTDDDNKDDNTVLKVPLHKVVGPHETITLQFAWTAKIPKTMPRTGYNMDYYFFAQWFPKVGVYEPAGMRYSESGGWNCHQYHSSGEYYSDFGNYNVRLTVPENYVVAASGQLIGKEAKDRMQTWQFFAEDVIDFTWTTSPHYEIVTDNHEQTEINIYSYPEKKHFSERYLKTIKYCMAYLDEHLGPYPYPTLSIIDPPIHGLFTGGMEYPTLITALSFNSFPAGFKTPETLVVHEYIHQYFMQMVATHEVEEAWMDEGFTTYYESRILDSYMSETTSTIELLGFNAGNKEWNRAEFLSSSDKESAPNTVKSWQYEGDGYGPISYNKTAMWLQTLEGLVGVATMDEIMKTYFQRWKFLHPCRQDFIDVANKIVIKNNGAQFPDGMDWYFEQVIYGTALCDYEVVSIDNQEVNPERGFISSSDNCEVIDADKASITSKVVICRNEGIQLPIELEVTYEDGTTFLELWDGKDRCKTFTFSSLQKVIKAELDPDRKIYMDGNFLNNSLLIEKKPGGVRAFFARFITSAQHIFETISLII